LPEHDFLGRRIQPGGLRQAFPLNPKELDELESLGQRELAIKVDGEPLVAGGDGYFKVLRMNMDPAAYARATTKPSERMMRETGDSGMKQLQERAAAYRGSQ
jgi:hypothetical protein